MVERLDNSLKKWGLDLTRRHKVFKHDQSLTPQHFSYLTKDERLQPMLSFLIRHVRPPEEQRQIKLNLKHAQLRKKLAGGECEVSTSDERLRLKTAIIDTRSTISSEVLEIQQLSQKKEEFHQRGIELRQRATLLKVVTEEQEKESQRYKSLNLHLNALLNTVPANSEKCSSSSIVDPSVQQLLRSNLLDIESVHHLVISGELAAIDQIHEKKLQLWEHIEESLEDWGPRIMLAGLLAEVREGTRNLQSLVQRVDLARDARELRFKCEKDGSFIDEMNPVGVIESVRELLDQMNAAHVKLYLEAYRVDQAAASLSRVLASVTNNIIASVKRNYDESVATAVIGLVKENIAVVGERSALNVTHTLMESLKDRAETAARARDALRAKYAKMTSFDKEVNSGLESIHCLTACVKDSLDNIGNHVEKVRLDVNSVVDSTTRPTPITKNALSNECRSFTEVPLSHLLTANVDGCGIQQKANMTTNSLVWYDKNLAESGWSALTALGMGQLCWDGVYNVVVDRMNHVTSLRNQMDQLINLKAAVSSAEKKAKILSRQEVKELADTAAKNDAKLEEVVTKLAATYEKHINDCHQYLGIMNRVLSEWWEQPAKKVIIEKLED